MDTERTGKKPLYVYYMIAAIIIVLLNVLLVPALFRREVLSVQIIPPLLKAWKKDM